MSTAKIPFHTEECYRSGKCIGHPTGPATAAGHEMLEHFDPKSGPCHLSQAGARSIVLAIEGQTAARIFAALPAALHEHAVQHRDALPCNELCAAALLAAIEKELAKDW